MKPKLLLGLALVLGGGIFGCASHPTQSQSIKVNVLGWVKTPGTYVLPKGSGIVAALDAAGSFRDMAHSSSLRVVRMTGGQTNQFSVRLQYDNSGKPKADFEVIDGDTVTANEIFW